MQEAVPAFLVLGASIMAGYAGSWLLRRHHVSDILPLVAIGFILGPLFGVVDPGLLGLALPIVGPLALAVVLFERGLDLDVPRIRANAGRALGLTLATWSGTAIAVAFAAHRFADLSLPLAALLGTAVAAPGILSVGTILAALHAPPQVRLLLTVETTLGDLLSALSTTALAGFLVLGLSPWAGGTMLATKLLVGLAMGLVCGLAWARALAHMENASHGFALTLATLLVSYAATEVLGGSGLLMALTFGVIVGNAAWIQRAGLPGVAGVAASTRGHQGELVFILRSFVFLQLGIAAPRALLSSNYLIPGLAILAAIVIARILTVTLATWGDRGLDGPSRVLVTSMMPRGLAAVVIAGIPLAMGVPGAEALPPLALLVVVAADLATSAGLRTYAIRKGARDKRAQPGAATLDA